MAIGKELEQQNIIKELRDSAISVVDQRTKVLNKLLTVRDLLTDRWQGITNTSIAANSNTHSRALVVQAYSNTISYGADPSKLVHYNFDSDLWSSTPPIFSQIPTLDSMRVVIVDDTLSNVVTLSADPSDPLYFGNFYFTQNRSTGELLNIDEDINAFITPNGAIPYHPKNNINGNAFDGTPPNPSASSDVRTDYAINRSRNVIQSVYSATFVLEIKLTNVVNGIPEPNDTISIERANFVITKVSEYDSTLQEATIEISNFDSITDLEPQQKVISQTTPWTADISYFGTVGRWALNTTQPFIFSTNISNYWLEKYSALPIGSFTSASSDGFQASSLTFSHNISSGTLHPGSGEINEVSDSSDVEVPEIGKTYPIKSWDTNDVVYFALCSVGGLEQQPGWNSNTASLTTTTYYDNDEPLKLSYDNWVSTLGYGNASPELTDTTDPFSADSIVRGSDPTIRSGGPMANNVNEGLPKWNNPLFPFIGINQYDNDGEPYRQDKTFEVAKDMVSAVYTVSANTRWNYGIVQNPFGATTTPPSPLDIFDRYRSSIAPAASLFSVANTYTYNVPPAPPVKVIHANTAFNLVTTYTARLGSYIIDARTDYDNSVGNADFTTSETDFDFKSLLDDEGLTPSVNSWLLNFEMPPDGYQTEDTSSTRSDFTIFNTEIIDFWDNVVAVNPGSSAILTSTTVANVAVITDLETTVSVYTEHIDQITTELEQIGEQIHAIAADASDDILGIYKELRREITKEKDIYEFIRKQRSRYSRFI